MSQGVPPTTTKSASDEGSDARLPPGYVPGLAVSQVTEPEVTEISTLRPVPWTNVALGLKVTQVGEEKASLRGLEDQATVPDGFRIRTRYTEPGTALIFTLSCLMRVLFPSLMAKVWLASPSTLTLPSSTDCVMLSRREKTIAWFVNPPSFQLQKNRYPLEV